MMKTNILIVDDDPGIGELLKRYLNEQGFDVYVANNASEMDIILAAENIALMILDLMLPGEDGLSIARRLRMNSGLPIIMLSAHGDEVERIIGLEMGADDYLAKPFNPRELLARIRAILRRNQEIKSPLAETEPQPLTQLFVFGKYCLDIEQHSFYQHENNIKQEISLTSGEFNLLAILLKHPNHVLSRDHIMDLIVGSERSPYDRSIDIRITRLRKKIEDNPKKPLFIRTIWGEGYMFTPLGSVE